MIGYGCPHCGEGLEAPESLGGDEMLCPSCQGRTIVPRRVARRTYQATQPGISGVTVPLLISGIANIVVGLLWLGATFGCAFPISIGLWVLAVFEFMLYASAERMPITKLGRQAHTLGIIEIVAGLFNTVTLVCGIIVLVHASKLPSHRGGGSTDHVCPSCDYDLRGQVSPGCPECGWGRH